LITTPRYDPRGDFLKGEDTVPYIHFTDEQKERANSVDLPDFLEWQGEKLEKSGGEWRWTSDRGITVRSNEWYNHYEDRGGGSVSFVREHYNLSYPEAVTMLLNGEQGEVVTNDRQKSRKEKKPFELPERSDTMRRVFAYLIKQRYIDGDIISHFAHERTLYEDKEFHNAVFVGCDENGVPRHATKKGTYSDGSYRGDVESSDPRYSFRHIGESDTLHVFEAPVDMLSYITMNKQDWQRQSYVALDGVTEHAMLWILEQNPHVTKVRLCLDHDPAGIEAAYRLTEILAGRGYADVEPMHPMNKDWNEDRKAQLGYNPEPARENPKILSFYEVFGELYYLHGDILPEKADTDTIGRHVDLLNRRYRNGGFPNMQKSLNTIYAHSLVSAADQMRRIGKPVTMEQLAEKILCDYAPHKDRGGMRSRCEDMSRLLRVMQVQSISPGIRTTTERESEINNYVSLARECVKALSFLRLEDQRQEQESGAAVHSMVMM